MPHLVSLYQQQMAAIFYPGITAYDLLGMRIRALTGRKVPVITTLEGLAMPTPEAKLVEAAGHKVFLQSATEDASRRVDALLRSADHVIAISPFLQRIGRALYGDKFSFLPLGVDASLFHARDRNLPTRPRVVSTGHVAPHKRPKLFIDAALQNPSADFIWFGDGPELASLREKVREQRIPNLTFAGRKMPHDLADELRQSSIFVLCSLSEGAPKALQEAAACGLPLIAFNFYEPPSVTHGENGLLAGSDEDWFSHLRCLIQDAALAKRMGSRSAELALDWDWDLVAPRWEHTIREKVHELSSANLA